MSRNRDPLELSPHWHVDCRLVDELPDDNLVGTRFLINAAFGALAVAAVIFAGWLFYLSSNLRYQIRDWEQRIADNRAEVRDIQRMKIEFGAEAAKIDQAFALVKPQFKVSTLIASLGRTRPEQMLIEVIDWSDPTVMVLRGSLRATSQQASQVLGDYVKLLIRDENIGPLFREIVITNLDRGTTGDLLKFEVAFRLKPKS